MTVSQFYYGTNLVEYKSDIDFAEVVDIEGLAVDDEMGLVWVGNKTDEVIKVTKATLSDDYATWTDYTDTLPSDDTWSLRRVK